MVFTQECFESGARACGEGALRDEIFLVAGMAQRASSGSQCNGRHEDVEMGMMERASSPCVKDGDEADVASEVLGIEAQVAEGG